MALFRVACVALALGCWCSPALAQGSGDDVASDAEQTDVREAFLGEREAREAFQGAVTEFDAGNYAAALPAFERAYELSGRSALLYNIALCHDRLGHEREALTAYTRFLDATPDSDRRRAIDVRIGVLEDSLARTAALSAAASHAPAESGENLLESPILWTLVALALVGVGVGIGLGVGLSQDPGMQAPTAGPSGILVFALTD